MVRFLVERPIAVLVSFFALLLLGISAFMQLPASLLPEVDIPQINVNVKMPNAGAREIEQNIIANLRTNLQQLHGLESIESSSSEGEGQIQLLFEHGMNTSLAFIEVNEKVDRAMNNLPKDLQRPLINKVTVADIPIFRLNIYPKGVINKRRLAELSSFTREVIKRRLEQQSEISMVDVTGLSEPEVQVIPKEDYLRGIGISTNYLLQAFQENKINLGNILVKDGHYQYYLQFNSDVVSLEAIENTPLNVNGRLFALKDLAEVRFSYAEESGSFYTNGKRGVNLAIMKRSSAKMDDLQKSFYGQLDYFKDDYPDLEFEVSNNQTELLDFSINNLQQDLLIGGILAFLLMLVFIRQIRAALLIGITIPVSLVISMLGFYFMGINLNIISLGGLILGLAMIIDNSIVVIDTINLKKEAGFTNQEAAINGTNEIIRPLITSVLTNCAVFIPLIFLSGLAGAIFYDQAISITIGVIASLIVSILLLPPLYVLFYRIKTKREKPVEIPAYVNVTRWYEGGLSFVFKFPKLTFLLVTLLFGSAFIFFKVLDKERLPPVSRDDFELFVDWNESIGVSENENRVAHLLSAIQQKVVVADAWIGKQQYLFLKDAELGIKEAKLYVKVRDKNDLNTVKVTLEKLCHQEYPLAVLRFQLGKNAFDAVFADQMAPLRIETVAFDKRVMPPIETSVALVQELTRLLPDAYINPVALHDKVVLRVKAETALRYKVSISDVNRELQAVLKPYFVEYYEGAQALVPIVMLRGSGKAIDHVLSENFVNNRDQMEIPLHSLVDVSSVKEYQSITAGISGAYYPIDIESDQPESDLKTLKTFMKEHPVVDAVYTGSYFTNQALIKEMAIIFLISVLLLYFILAAQFESLLQPLFILIELPIAMSGAFIFLYFGNNSLNLMSMIGLIVMSGLIINDSILKIDAINQLRRQGMGLKKAIYDGGHKRLKPIIMITITSVGALLPTLFMHDLGSELQKPLALALIGGMLVGMLVSLFFVPLIYWLIYKKEEERNIKLKETL